MLLKLRSANVVSTIIMTSKYVPYTVINKTIKQPNSLNILGLKRSLKLNLDVLVPRAFSLLERFLFQFKGAKMAQGPQEGLRNPIFESIRFYYCGFFSCVK